MSKTKCFSQGGPDLRHDCMDKQEVSAVASNGVLCAKQCLALLVMDLRYDSSPKNGHAPLRHQLAWTYAEDILGKEETGKIVERCKTHRDY